MDETQEVAKAYGAVCTPDIFGYDAHLQLQYRGRLDAGGAKPAPFRSSGKRVDAMKLIATTGKGPIPSIRVLAVPLNGDESLKTMASQCSNPLLSVIMPITIRLNNHSQNMVK